jgi:hypothetical protein
MMTRTAYFWSANTLLPFRDNVIVPKRRYPRKAQISVLCSVQEKALGLVHLQEISLTFAVSTVGPRVTYHLLLYGYSHERLGTAVLYPPSLIGRPVHTKFGTDNPHTSANNKCLGLVVLSLRCRRGIQQ